MTRRARRPLAAAGACAALIAALALPGCRREAAPPATSDATPARPDPQVTAAATPRAAEDALPTEVVTDGRFSAQRRVLSRADFEQASAPVAPEALARVLEVRGYTAQRERIGDLLEVRLDIYNIQRDRHLDFEVRTLFFREDDQLIDATPWTRAVAEPRRAFRYRAVAYSPKAVAELVQIRLPEQPAAISAIAREQAGASR